ncbi:MarR family winged helix-turn-helix transcriptional regulator [uncultured Jatrophihabitans sp.]|uniref:MarR family winged helix-turn-helix transcriptional regulator n=1 Tax=uncultured Jatrophihabitans sp. TaxID=1610747 RepID=UPI0035CC2D73
MGDPDIIDNMVAEWRSARPDLDDEAYDAMGTVGRLTRVGLLLAPLIDRVLAERGLGRGEFDVLATLRRQGEPFTMTPTTMSRLLILSPGAMTNRLDRLEAGGHVQRAHDPVNRRSVLVTLTPAGRALVDEALDAHTANERQLLDALSPTERRRLDAALRRLLHVLEE